jgi:hypothetical protein
MTLPTPLSNSMSVPFASSDPQIDQKFKEGHIEPVAGHMLVRAGNNSCSDFQYYITVYKNSGVNTSNSVYLPQVNSDFSNIVIIADNGQLCNTKVDKINTTDAAHPYVKVFFKLPHMYTKGAVFYVGTGNAFVCAETRNDQSGVFEPYLKNSDYERNSIGSVQANIVQYWTVSDPWGGGYNLNYYASDATWTRWTFYADGYCGSGGSYDRTHTQYWRAPINTQYRLMSTTYTAFNNAYVQQYAAMYVAVNGSNIVNQSGQQTDLVTNSLNGDYDSGGAGAYIKICQGSGHNPGVGASWGTVIADNFRLMKYLDPDVTQGYWS